MENTNGFSKNKLPAHNSGLAQLGFQANFKVGFVLGSSVLNPYIWLTKSPTDAKPRDVIWHLRIRVLRKLLKEKALFIETQK